MNAVTVYPATTLPIFDLQGATRIGLFYDTETTGLPLWKEPSEDERQPHIVELAASLVDLDTRTILYSLHSIVRPDGWTIPDEVAAIHGITTERALAEGVDEATVVSAFMFMHAAASKRVAHNQSFDARILRIALKRFGYSEDELEEFKAAPSECTCYGARPHTKLPKNKLPKLGEAYRHFTGLELEGAHSAVADVAGCIAVYFGIADATGPVLAADTGNIPL